LTCFEIYSLEAAKIESFYISIVVVDLKHFHTLLGTIQQYNQHFNIK